MKYNLEVILIPKEHYIKVKGSIRNITIPTGANIFYLNENFKINKLSSNSQDVEYIHDKTKPHPMYDVTSRPVILKTPIDSMDFEYDGYISEITNDINLIDESIVELSSYSGWYPKDIMFLKNIDTFDILKNKQEFEFELTVELPNEYIFCANAEIKGVKKSSAGITIYNICSYGIDSDIAIFASNKVVRIEKSANGLTVTSICPPNMAKNNSLKLDKLIEGQQRITRLLGNPIKEQQMCYINRPRGGWGYARTAFVSMPGVTDENNEWIGELSESSIIKGIGGDLHELAHSWWSIASGDYSSDWINEGGAEYTMLCVLKDMLNLKDYSGLIEEREYIKQIAELPSESAINETKADDWTDEYDARYVNRYEKTAIMYIGAEIRFGKENLFAFLKEFYEQNKIERNADTQKFLSVCEDILGKEAKEYFNWLLSAKGWKNINVQRDILKYKN